MKPIKIYLGACALTLCLLAAMAACTDSPASANGSETDTTGDNGSTAAPPESMAGETSPADSTAHAEQTTEAITLPPDILETGGDMKLETDGNGHIVFPDDVFE